MLKKLNALFMAIILMLVSGLTAYAEESGSSTYDEIINQALAMDNTENKTGKVFSVVTENTNTNSRGVSGDGQQIIMSTSTEGDLTSVMLVFPYKCTEEGQWINSFDYVSSNKARMSSTKPVQLVDVTVTLIATYACEQNVNYWWYFYRHAGIEAYWSSSNSTASVSNMKAWFECYGELHEYPACIQAENSSDTKLSGTNGVYSAVSTINVSNAIKGQTYINVDGAMPYNRMITCSDYFLHSGEVGIEITYIVNGTARTFAQDYLLFSKDTSPYS